MFFLPLLIHFSISASGRIRSLTKSSFTKFVEKRNKKEIWIVMLHTDSNYLSQKVYPKFLNASNLAGGMFKFGLIDTKAQTLLTRQLLPKNQPTIYVYHKDGHKEYDGDYEPYDLIDFASQYLSDDSREIDEEWATSITKPEAILFTKKEVTPSLWLGISHVFEKRLVKIGICRNESLKALFNVDEFPAIVFVNKTMKHAYTGKLEFALIQRELQKFIDKELKFEDENKTKKIFPSSEFEKECIGGLKTCVLYATKNVDDVDFKDMKRRYEDFKFKWFIGYEGIPFKFMKENSIWVYNPILDGFVEEEKLINLGTILEKVYASTIELTPRIDLMKESEL